MQAWYWGWWTTRTKGSDTSGNYQHRGRKGKKGGSLPGGGHGAIGISGVSTPDEKKQIINQHRQAQADKGKSEGARVRAGLARIEAKREAEIAKLKAQGEKILAERKAYMKEYAEPLYNRYRIARREMDPADPELAEMQAELDRHDAHMKAQFDQYLDLGKEQRALEQQAQEDALKLLEAPKEYQGTVKARTSTPEIDQAAQDGVAIFNRLFGRGTLENEWARTGKHERSRAGYESFRMEGGTGVIWLSSDSGSRSMLHEMGHWLEDRDHGVRTKAQAFFERRTRGEQIKKLADLKPEAGYASYEVCKPDRFVVPYIGRIYDEPGIAGNSSEVISMGLELVYHHPFQFAKDDPDHFDFIINLMRERP